MFRNLVYGLLISGLSGDILYLYYAGGWIEPIKWIEAIELVMLYCFLISGLILAGKGVQQIFRSGIERAQTSVK